MTCSRWDVCGMRQFEKFFMGSVTFPEKANPTGQQVGVARGGVSNAARPVKSRHLIWDSRKILLLVIDFPPREEIQNGWSRVNSTSKLKINHSITTKLTLGEE